MYFPYFRGKQYELIAIREAASTLATAGFVPVIEPVKEALGGLQRALSAICDASGKAVVVVNPHHGDHSQDGEGITTLLKEQFLVRPEISAGILLKEVMSIEQVMTCCQEHRDHEITLIHAGFTDAKGLASGLGENFSSIRHVFLEPYCGKLYRKHFSGTQRVLVRNGFIKQRRNSDYVELEAFSDLHVTYAEEGMDGFGDFLTVGDDYSVGGGPAYAIAIHLTFIDSDKDDAMFIYHFKSLRIDTPVDPAGKFAEALDAMMTKLNEGNSKVLETEAVKEFRSLHEKNHFPGLGYVKKLSLQHHIETLAYYFK